MKVQPPSSYSLPVADRIRRALFALAAGAAATAASQSPEPAAEAATAEAEQQAIVPRTIDFSELPMTPMMVTPKLEPAELEALQNMTPRPLSTFSPEELEQFRASLLAPRTIDIELPDPAAPDAMLTVATNAVPTAAAGTVTNAVPTTAEATAPKTDNEERSEP